MKLRKLKLENFRGYKVETVVDINDLNVFVGKNDIGKSTILEALDIFFNENKGIVKIDKNDINTECLREGNVDIKISAVFDDLPNELTIDASYQTTLANEFLLQKDNTLEIMKVFPNAGKERVFLIALHPTNTECSDLHLKKNADLKKMLKDDMDCEDKTKNAVIRKAIWDFHIEDLNLQEIEIEIAKFDSKNIWEHIKKHMPLYTLFQSDRKNSDGDNEVQNPMKFAVQEILKNESLRELLDKVATEVEAKLKIVSNKTLEKLKEMNSEIADSLNPIIPSPESLKWEDVFKNVSITGDDDIPINKRGSGVKRLVLLNFFRAEAERRQQENNFSSVIYAIEEPETSQHPNHQRKLIEAFIRLSESKGTQVLLTTHSPSIVRLLQFKHLKLISSGDKKSIVQVEKGNLPYPSLNEVSYLAFGESNEEYHNELYGFIESENLLEEYKKDKKTLDYVRIKNGNKKIKENKVLSEYIRHQIHHPENIENQKFTNDQLQESIYKMREFINFQVNAGLQLF